MRTQFCQSAITRMVVCIFLLLTSVTTVLAESSLAAPVKVKMLMVPFLSCAPLFIAEEEGFFTEQGLEIEYIKMEGATKAIPALLQGDIDVIPGSVSLSLLNAISRGGTIKIVADKGRISSATGCVSKGMLASKDAVQAGELDNPVQLKGKRISVNPVDTDGYYVEKVLNKGGLTFDDVTTEDVPPPAIAKGLETGALDVAHAGEPWISRILQTGNAVLWVPAKDVVPNFQFAVILYGPSFLQEQPDIGEKFMIAYLKAVRQYNQGKTPRNIEILAKHTELDPELVREACWITIAHDGSINIPSVLEFQTWGLQKGLIDSPVKESQFWDPHFIEYANQVLDSSAE